MLNNPFRSSTGQARGLLTYLAVRHLDAVPIAVDAPLDISPQLGLEFTFGDFARLTEDFAARLHTAGVRPGHTVAVSKSHNADILVLATAIARVGAVPALLSPALDGASASRLLGKIGPSYVVSDQGTLERNAAHRPELDGFVSRLLLAGGHVAGVRSLLDMHGRNQAPLCAVRSDQPAMITHTSGTTGEPKLVTQSVAGLEAHAILQLRIARMLSISEPYAMCVSFAHARTYSALAVGMRRGMPLALLSDHDVTSVASTFHRFRPGLVETHPNTFIQWEDLVDHPNRPLSNVKYYVSTFDAIHPRTVRRLLSGSARRGAMYLQAYGQTETGPVTVRPYTRFLARHADGRCVGFPIPGLTKVRVNAPSKGGRGEIEVQSLGQGMRYVGADADFSAGMDGAWWGMGDVGFKSRWGCLHLLDRQVDQVPELDSLLALEDSLINRVHQLTEVVVVPRPSGALQPVVCTRNHQPFDHGAWKAAVAGLPRMADPLHCPWEDLPQTATWKVKRLELARLLEEGELVPKLAGPIVAAEA